MLVHAVYELIEGSVVQRIRLRSPAIKRRLCVVTVVLREN